MYTWLSYTVLFFLVIATPQMGVAQNCTANAGTLSIAQNLFCPQDTVTVTTSGDKPNFVTQFLLADTLNVFLIVGNTTGQFTGLSEGTYRVFSINFDPNNQPIQPPVVGGSISDIQDIATNCFDISTSVTFTVADTVAPVAVCATEPVNVYLDAQGGFDISAADLDFGSFDDGCSGIAGFRLSQSMFSCSDLGQQQVELIVEDGSGNTDTCLTVLNVQDTLAPVVQCAAPATVSLNADGEYQPDLFAIDNGSSDNCELGQLLLSQTTFTCQDTGAQELFLIAEDGQGNRDSCRWSFTLIDDSPPTANCPTDITRFLDADGQIALTADDLDNGSSDNCGITSRSVLPTSFSCSDTGIQEAYLTVADAAGNVTVCTTLVDVIDNTPPVAACVGVTPLYLDQTGQAILSVEAVDDGSMDNCSGAMLTLSKTAFSCADLGSENVTLTITDGTGRSDQCTTSVSILDTIRPQAICAPVTLALDANGTATLLPGQVNGGSTDNCGISDVSLSQTAFACADLGQQEIVLTVEDVAGLTDTCRAAITITDNENPQAVCRDITIYLNEIGSATISASDLDNGSADNCQLSALTINRAVFGCADLGERTVTLTARDGAGNEDQCLATVTVRDTVAPVALCQPVTAYLDAFGQTTLQPEMVNNNSRDNCGSLSNLLLSEYLYFCEDIGNTTVTLFVTDASGNTGSCEAPVTVVDTIAPQASCQDVTLYLNDRGVATLTPDSLNAGSVDNCSVPLSFDADQERFTCSDLGQQPVMLTVSDPYNNQSVCTAQVTILDTLPPTVTCQPVTLYLDENGTQTLTPSAINSSRSDNCGVPSFLELSQSLFDCSDVGTSELVLTLEDPSGNIAQCTTAVTVLDTVAPSANCRDFTLEVGINGQARLTPDLINEASFDNCTSPLQFELDRDAFTCADLGPNTVVLTVMDEAQNSDTCRSTVTVIDSKLPEVNTRNIEVYLTENGTATIRPADVEDGSTDNCTIVDSLLDRQTFTCADVGPNLISLTLTDIDGNAATETAVVTVLDTIAPVLSCPPALHVNTSQDGGEDCNYVLDDLSLDPLYTSDNCSLQLLQHDFAQAPSDSTLLGASFSTGTHDIVWTLTDVNGRRSSCTVSITVEDDEAPVARCRDTVLVQLSEAGQLTLDSARVDLGSTDNCGITSYELSRTDFTCDDVGYRLVTVQMADASGNQTACAVVVGITASDACPEPVFTNANVMEMPEISDPCSCRGDGSFDETVVIGPTTPGQAWTVKATDLLNPTTLNPYAVGTPFVEVDQGDGSSIYLLDGVHLSGEGYTITAESPMFASDLSISNVCYYPEPEIIGLDGPICLFTNPITLEGNGGDGVSGTGSFTINGQPANVLDPAVLGVGTHTVTYTFDAGNPAGLNEPDDVGCAVTIAQDVTVIETPENLACNDMVTVTVNAGCEILIRPEMVLSGNYLCYDDYEVFISYQGQGVPNPVPAQYAGLRLNTLVQHKPSGRVCFGDIQLKDVQGPQIDSCAADIRNRFVCTDLDLILNNPETIDPASPYFTGRPAVEDNCSGTELTFQDQLFDLDDCTGDQETAYIRRRFFAEDKFGNVSTCDQLIYFERPQAVLFPADTLIREDCTAAPLVLNNEGNVDPSVAGWPYFVNGFGELVPITGMGNSCSYSVIYEDTRINQCAAQYILLREWRIFDACANQTVYTVTQRIDVGDFDAPIVSCPAVDLDFDGLIDDVPVYSTGAADCTATLNIPEPQVEDCSEYTVTTKIFSWVPETNFGFPTGDTLFQELDGVAITDGIASNVPVGEHYFIYTVRDVCGNTTMDTCAFQVEDRVSPTVFCDDDIIVSIGSSGEAMVLPVDIDEGSRDNCDSQDDLEFALRRLVPADCHASGTATYSAWGDNITVNCCDVGRLVTLEMRVRDQSGNTNVCVSRLRVEDKVRPECTAPIDLRVDCNDLPADFDPSDVASLQRRFGVPDVTDNCQESASWQELPPLIDLDECGFGTITRQFRASDGFGNVSQSACEQVITVEEVHHYKMRFPADTATNCVGPNIAGVSFEEIACDLLAVSVESDTFFAAVEGCFKVHRTYQVVNWCEYDGVSDPVILPRNADCDDTPGDEPLWVIVEPDGTVFLDRDDDPENLIPAAGQKMTSCDGLTNPSGYWISNNQQPGYDSRGFWSYTQHITVYDDTAPVVTVTAPAPFCSTDKSACTGPVNIPFRVEEACSIPEDVTITVRLDAGDDGTFEQTLDAAQLTGNYPNFTIVGTFPIGSHALELSVSDGCGNTSIHRVPFVVEDCQAPAPICINGLSVELGALPGDEDLDGDDIVDLASAKVAADDLLAGLVTDCSGPVYYSINRQGMSADSTQDSLLLTCVDEGTVLVELHAWDTADNHDFCATYIEVQNNGDVCTDIPEGEIMGQVSTETGMMLPSVTVRLSGTANRSVLTDFRGRYRFDELEEGGDYSVIPLFTDQPANGITTFDLILIRRHILGMGGLDSPYKLIAADVNNSGTISVLDMIQLQRMILGYTATFPDNRSWRFVDASYTFPDPENPWGQGFPEVRNINNLEAQISGADFVAVKIGDVNHTVSIAGATASVRSDRPEVRFEVEDQLLAAGELVDVAFFLPEGELLEGYQFTLQYDPEVVDVEEVVHDLAGPEQFGYFPGEGILTTHWFRTGKESPGQRRLFTLRLRSEKARYVSEVIQLTSRVTQAEAYRSDGTMLQPVLSFREAAVQSDNFRLYPNVPNPFREETTIRVYVPEVTTGTLTIFDAKGKVVRQVEQEYFEGMNEVRITRAGLPAGVLYYRFASASWQASRKMILLK